MAIHHRKQLPEKDSHRKPSFPDCCSTCTPYDCGCIPIRWPQEPPQLPPPSTDTATTYISPYLIITVALITTSIFLITYYFIVIRFCSRFRQLSATQVNDHSPDVLNQDHQSEIDNPIWYISTVGLQPPVINSITVVKFNEGDSMINYTNCSVCLSEFKDNESIRLLPKCNHAFHILCIDTWLRSHTNCPLCRAPVVHDNSNVISQSNDQNRNHGLGLSQNSQVENGDNNGELSSSDGQEGERHEYSGELGNVVEVEDGSKGIEDSKEEIETLITLSRSFSMDSAAEIVFTDSSSTNSTIEVQRGSHLRD